jgi:hypothetical protein
MDTVESGWASFARAVLPADAPPDQHREMRRAFYAGAWWFLSGFASLGEPDVSEEEGVRALEAAKAEIDAFYRDLRAGRA